jgi:hypothetical protein
MRRASNPAYCVSGGLAAGDFAVVHGALAQEALDFFFRDARAARTQVNNPDLAGLDQGMAVRVGDV